MNEKQAHVLKTIEQRYEKEKQSKNRKERRRNLQERTNKGTGRRKPCHKNIKLRYLSKEEKDDH